MAALVIFLTAVSILLTISVPSYIMQAKREQEKELIFRGEEYTRAIQKFQRTLNLLPAGVDELLSSNGTRFLRKAYVDPISGEPWRPIILNSDGTLTGSNLYPTMGQVPTTTSVRAPAPAAPAPAAAGNTIGTLATASPFSSGPGASMGAGGGGLGGAGGGGLGGAGGGLGGAGGGVGGAGTGLTGGAPGATGTRPAGTGAVTPTPGTPAPAAQATPLQGLVGIGSASKGPSVMVWDKQDQYSNWEFIAVLQQRGNAGAAGGGGGGGGGAAPRGNGGAPTPGGGGAGPAPGGGGGGARR